ncbi:MAG: hypothetical protein RMJ56_06050 [Gemmataceae bacterium]|nr:hypothetical protein [Gemmata sp.]MDW8197152.1 hypothetical protein [Gemmataceae bacterium]
MTPAEAVTRLNTVLAHAWMIRTFLKHADEIQQSDEMLEVPRTLYDSIRAVEPAFQRHDHGDYLRRLKGKLPKLRRIADYFHHHYKQFSPHTNFEMAAISLQGVVQQIDEILQQVDWTEVGKLLPGHPSSADTANPPTSADTANPPASADTANPPADPLDQLEIPEV